MEISNVFFYFLKLLCTTTYLSYVILSYLACTSEEELPNLTKIVFEKKRDDLNVDGN